MRKDNTFHRGWDGCCWVGVTFRCHLQLAHTVPKNAPLRGWNLASVPPAGGKTLFISSRAPFVISLRRRRRRPIMKTAKRKFMFQCFLPPLPPPCIGQTKRPPPPSISSIFLLTPRNNPRARSSTLNLAACEKPHRQKSPTAIGN